MDLKTSIQNAETQLMKIKEEWQTTSSTITSILNTTNTTSFSFPTLSPIKDNLDSFSMTLQNIYSEVNNPPYNKHAIYSMFKKIQEFITQSDAQNKKNEERVGMRKTRMGLYAKENESLKMSERLASDVADNINATVFMVEQQDQRMNSVRLRWNDMKGVLGLSRSVMQMITNRNTTDKIIVYGGLIVIIIILVLIYYYFK
ncbi:Uncharacterized protein QTN25_003073 [Entamoeba marina]